MKLNIGERFALLNILPQKEDFANLKILRKLKEDLSFSEKEFKEYKFTEMPEGGLRWPPEVANITKEIQVGEIATQIIVEKLKELNRTKELPDECYTVYEKFVEKQK